MRKNARSPLSALSSKSLLAIATLAVGLVLGARPAHAVFLGVDLIVVIDESGSMGGEQAFIGGAIVALDAALGVAGLTSNQYGLVGYGARDSHSGVGSDGHKHAVGGGEFGSAAQFNTATGSLVTSGGFEDGYEAIDFALNNYTFRDSKYAKQIILVTDEDRDIADANITESTVLKQLKALGAKLNVIIDGTIRDDAKSTVLGTDGTNAYSADGSGGFTVSSGGDCGDPQDEDSCRDYFQLALDTDGAAWDLKQLRAGGKTAISFAEALVDVKVQEIITPPSVPEPSSLLLLSGGLLLIGLRLNRR